MSESFDGIQFRSDGTYYLALFDIDDGEIICLFV
jgi:hypothetical protein